MITRWSLLNLERIDRGILIFTTALLPRFLKTEDYNHDDLISLGYKLLNLKKTIIDIIVIPGTLHCSQLCELFVR